MTTPFLLEIPPRGMIEEISQHDRIQRIGYHGDPERDLALEAVFQSLEAFAERPENREALCKALDRCAPELSILAGHVAAINRLEDAVAYRDLDERETEAVENLRKQTANMWAHSRAGQIMIDSLEPLNAPSAPKIPEGYVWPKRPTCGCGIWPDGTGHHSAACVDQHAVCDASRVDPSP